MYDLMDDDFDFGHGIIIVIIILIIFGVGWWSGVNFEKAQITKHNETVQQLQKGK